MRVRSPRGFTLIELLIVVSVIGVLAALAVHAVMRARAAANEASAIGTLRAVASGQVGYAATCGVGHYAETLVTLADGKYVSPDVSLTPKSGYVFTMTPGVSSGLVDCVGAVSRASYYLSGVPLTAKSGHRGFAVNQGGGIWQDIAGTAPPEPFERTATISPIQ